MLKIALTDQEHAYVLAGLRALQRAKPALADDLVQEYVADGGLATLTDSGIDELCERINTESEEVDVAGLPHEHVLKAKNYRFNCCWAMHGSMTVTAKSYDEAVEKAYGADLPDGVYVEDSFDIERQIDYDQQQ